MRHSIKMPRLGETTDTVVVIEWLIKVGSSVSEGDPLMTVETDKVTTEVPSPINGTCVEITVSEDDEVTTGEVICVMESS